MELVLQLDLEELDLDLAMDLVELEELDRAEAMDQAELAELDLAEAMDQVVWRSKKMSLFKTLLIIKTNRNSPFFGILRHLILVFLVYFHFFCLLLFFLKFCHDEAFKLIKINF